MVRIHLAELNQPKDHYIPDTSYHMSIINTSMPTANLSMEASSLKLLGTKESPFVHRVRLALKLKSIPYEFLEQTINPKSELLVQYNPVYKKVPVLLHNNKPICESLIIVQYIDEVWPNHGSSFLPFDPHDLSVIRFWAAYFEDKWISLSRKVSSTEGEAKEAAVARAVEGLVLLDHAFVKISKGKAYFGGDGIGFLDIAIGSMVNWIKAREIMSNVKLFDETKTPALVKWADNFTSNDVVKDVLPSTDEVMSYYYRARTAAAK